MVVILLGLVICSPCINLQVVDGSLRATMMKRSLRRIHILLDNCSMSRQHLVSTFIRALIICLPFSALFLSFQACLEWDDVLHTFPQPILNPLHQHWVTSTIATLTILFFLAYSVI